MIYMCARARVCDNYYYLNTYVYSFFRSIININNVNCNMFLQTKHFRLSGRCLTYGILTCTFLCIIKWTISFRSVHCFGRFIFVIIPNAGSLFSHLTSSYMSYFYNNNYYFFWSKTRLLIDQLWLSLS